MDESIREMHGRDFVGGRDSGYSFAGKGSFGGRVDCYTDHDVMMVVETGLTAEKPTSPADRDIVSSAGSDRYGGGRAGVHIRGGDEGRGFRSRAGGPYERPSRNVGGGGHMSSATFDRY
ncbi:BnaUnng02820D [Brassica napus]|uniref:BnaUnng02820D protein n=1 Tax=Brassica napus TaxID=3708 RepID=A0A078JPE4_BRANA|nr:BnaUnng02820D [Brassica napus]